MCPGPRTRGTRPRTARKLGAALAAREGITAAAPEGRGRGLVIARIARGGVQGGSSR